MRSSDKPITHSFSPHIFCPNIIHTRGCCQARCEGDLVGYDEENCFNSPAPVPSDSLTNEGFADSF